MSTGDVLYTRLQQHTQQYDAGNTSALYSLQQSLLQLLVSYTQSHKSGSNGIQQSQLPAVLSAVDKYVVSALRISHNAVITLAPYFSALLQLLYSKQYELYTHELQEAVLAVVNTCMTPQTAGVTVFVQSVVIDLTETLEDVNTIISTPTQCTSVDILHRTNSCYVCMTCSQAACYTGQQCVCQPGRREQCKCSVLSDHSIGVLSSRGVVVDKLITHLHNQPSVRLPMPDSTAVHFMCIRTIELVNKLVTNVNATYVTQQHVDALMLALTRLSSHTISDKHKLLQCSLRCIATLLQHFDINVRLRQYAFQVVLHNIQNALTSPGLLIQLTSVLKALLKRPNDLVSEQCVEQVIDILTILCSATNSACDDLKQLLLKYLCTCVQLEPSLSAHVPHALYMYTTSGTVLVQQHATKVFGICIRYASDVDDAAVAHIAQHTFACDLSTASTYNTNTAEGQPSKKQKLGHSDVADSTILSQQLCQRLLDLTSYRAHSFKTFEQAAQQAAAFATVAHIVLHATDCNLANIVSRTSEWIMFLLIQFPDHKSQLCGPVTQLIACLNTALNTTVAASSSVHQRCDFDVDQCSRCFHEYLKITSGASSLTDYHTRVLMRSLLSLHKLFMQSGRSDVDYKVLGHLMLNSQSTPFKQCVMLYLPYMCVRQSASDRIVAVKYVVNVLIAKAKMNNDLQLAALATLAAITCLPVEAASTSLPDRLSDDDIDRSTDTVSLHDIESTYSRQMQHLSCSPSGAQHYPDFFHATQCVDMCMQVLQSKPDTTIVQSALRLLLFALAHATTTDILTIVNKKGPPRPYTASAPPTVQLCEAAMMVLSLLVDDNLQTRHMTAQYISMLLGGNRTLTSMFGVHSDDTNDNAVTNFVRALSDAQVDAVARCGALQSSKTHFKLDLVCTGIEAAHSIGMHVDVASTAMRQVVLICVDGMTEAATRPSAATTLRQIAAKHNTWIDGMLNEHKHGVWPAIFTRIVTEGRSLMQLCENLLHVPANRIDDVAYQALLDVLPSMLIGGQMMLIQQMCELFGRTYEDTVERELHSILADILISAADSSRWPAAYNVFQHLTQLYNTHTLYALLDTKTPHRVMAKQVIHALVSRLGTLDDNVRQRVEYALWLHVSRATLVRGNNNAFDATKLPTTPARTDTVTMNKTVGKVYLQMCDELDSTIQSTDETKFTVSAKQRAVICLQYLIRLTGPRIDAYAAKTVQLLKNCLLHTALIQHALTAWDEFVHVLPVKEKADLLNTIVVALLPFTSINNSTLKQINGLAWQQQVYNTLSYLLRLPDSSGKMKPAVESLCIIMPTEVTHEKRFVTLLAEALATKSTDLSVQFQVSSKALQSDAVDVQIETLKQLNLYLTANRKSFVANNLKSNNVVALSNMLALLLKHCASTNEVVRGLSAECIGEIGAVDPARLPHGRQTVSAASDNMRPYIDDSGKYARDLVTSLVRALLTATSTNHQDRALYGIQELLKYLNCNDRVVELSKLDDQRRLQELNKQPTSQRADYITGITHWQSFTPAIQGIITPCTTSEYRYSDGTRQATAAAVSANVMAQNGSQDDDIPMSQYQHAKPTATIHTPKQKQKTKRHIKSTVLSTQPVKVHFKSSVPFRTWIAEWCRYMISHSNGPRAVIYKACEGATRSDVELDMVLLPELVDNTLRYGDADELEQVKWEVTAVLEYSASLSQSSQSSNHAQAVFESIDLVYHWMTQDDLHAVKSTLQMSRATSPSKRTVGLSSLRDRSRSLSDRRQWLDSAIPKLLLSRAAHGNKAHTRALKYMEEHCRDTVTRYKASHRHTSNSSSSMKAASVNKKAPSNLVPSSRLHGSLSVHSTPASTESANTSQLSDMIVSGESSGLLVSDVQYLQQVYAEIDEPDGLLGIRNLRSSHTLDEQLRDLEASSNWSDALTTYDYAIHKHPDRLDYHIGLLRSYRTVGQLQSAITYVNGTAAQEPHMLSALNGEGISSAWRLADWGVLDQYLQSRVDDTFEVMLARILCALRSGNDLDYLQYMQHARTLVINPIQATSYESYQRSYPYCLQLHLLEEVNQIKKLSMVQLRGVLPSQPADDITVSSIHSRNQFQLANMQSYWQHRLNSLSPAYKILEPVLSLRRVLYSVYGATDHVAQCWLDLAHAARKSGNYQTAQSALLQCRHVDSVSIAAQVEHAKLLYSKSSEHDALMYLEQVTALSKNTTAPRSDASDMLRAKQLLLLGKWCESSGARKSIQVREYYKQAAFNSRNWDKAHYKFASFIDKIIEAQLNAGKAQNDGNASVQQGKSSSTQQPIETQLYEMFDHYGKSLQYGHKYLFQSLPRMLTLWFDHAHKWNQLQQNRHSIDNDRYKAIDEAYKKCDALMVVLADELPGYMWLTALPQIISRFAHTNAKVVELIRRILCNTYKQHAAQCVWHMAAVQRGSDKSRRERAKDLMSTVKRSVGVNTEAGKCIAQSDELFKYLIDLCSTPVKSGSEIFISQSKTFKQLNILKADFVIVPIQLTMNVVLPTDGVSSSTQAHYRHNAFPHNLPHIAGFEDRVQVLSSKERPRKLVIRGDDGNTYPFLAKAEIKGDMRKNSRFMESNTVINRLLMRHSSSLTRALQLRTFAVSPLTDEAGLIEWVPHTSSLREILKECHQQIGVQMTTNAVRAKEREFEPTLTGQIALYRAVCEMYPPVFHRFYLNTFSEPTSWFEARLLFTRSCAVWSIVGWLSGLGDRHTENILIDTSSGECVHVDFDCLFNKGLTLEKPERVPFRLTPNMVDVCGFAGLTVDGPFRRSAEICLTVLRNNIGTMMNVLHSFLYDPLVEWKTSQRMQSQSQMSHIGSVASDSTGWDMNTDAVKQLTEIDNKLKGYMGSAYDILAHESTRRNLVSANVNQTTNETHTLPLSASGQVDQLIRDATDPNNLALMYIGWMPWL